MKNFAVRTLGIKKGLKINEYGVFKGERRTAGREETDVYAAVGLPWIPPELREMRGELDAARAGTLPDLVTLDDISGDLQMHTTATDGRSTLGEMARADNPPVGSTVYYYLKVYKPKMRARAEVVPTVDSEMAGLVVSGTF